MEGQSGVQNAASNLLCLPPLNKAFYRDEHLFVSLRDRLVILDSPGRRAEYCQEMGRRYRKDKPGRFIAAGN
jgi:hypothetical protein